MVVLSHFKWSWGSLGSLGCPSGSRGVDGSGQVWKTCTISGTQGWWGALEEFPGALWASPPSRERRLFPGRSQIRPPSWRVFPSALLTTWGRGWLHSPRGPLCGHGQWITRAPWISVVSYWKNVRNWARNEVAIGEIHAPPTRSQAGIGGLFLAKSDLCALTVKNQWFGGFTPAFKYNCHSQNSLVCMWAWYSGTLPWVFAFITSLTASFITCSPYIIIAKDIAWLDQMFKWHLSPMLFLIKLMKTHVMGKDWEMF